MKASVIIDKVWHGAIASLLVASVAGSAAAAECLVENRPLHTDGTNDIITRLCPPPGLLNRVRAGAGFFPGDGTKFIGAGKEAGPQTAIVQGFTSNNQPLSNCKLTVNNPADGQKTRSFGCANMGRWQLRMFTD
jgi:hypothetical protein